LFTVCTAVSGQECTVPDIVGSLDNNMEIISEDQTYILAGYVVQCEGIVTTWEFCYRILNATLLTFYPGIWKNTLGSGGDNAYSLIQSSTVKFTPNGTSANSCQNYTLPATEQFIAPSGSVVGLYSNKGIQRTLLLHTSTTNQITTYEVAGNQSTISTSANVVNYNIAVRVHLSKSWAVCTNWYYFM